MDESDYDLSNGLLAYWPFSGNANDESGNDLHGTVSGSELSTDRFESEKKAFSFNGASNFISMGNVLNDLKFTFTVSTWVYWEGMTADGEYGIISTDNSSGTYYEGLRIAISNNNRIYVRYGDGGYASSYARKDANTAANSVSLNNWTNIVVVAKGLTNTDIYIDGIQIPVSYGGDGGNMKHTGNPFVVGRYTYKQSSGEDWFFNGGIDDIRIYDRELSEDGIDNTIEKK